MSEKEIQILKKKLESQASVKVRMSPIFFIDHTKFNRDLLQYTDDAIVVSNVFERTVSHWYRDNTIFLYRRIDGSMTKNIETVVMGEMVMDNSYLTVDEYTWFCFDSVYLWRRKDESNPWVLFVNTTEEGIEHYDGEPDMYSKKIDSISTEKTHTFYLVDLKKKRGVSFIVQDGKDSEKAAEVFDIISKIFFKVKKMSEEENMQKPMQIPMKCGHKPINYEYGKNNDILFIRYICKYGHYTKWKAVGDLPFPDEIELEK